MDSEHEAKTLRDAHRDSIESFISAAETTPLSAWDAPLSEGKWSPSQVAEHLRLTYEVGGLELSGQAGLRVRTSWWARLMLRLRVLPVILRDGRIREGALAPRELRPGPGPFERESLLGKLREAADATEAALMVRVQSRSTGITHHVFGQLTPAQALRFLTVHNLHHARQLTDHSESATGTI